MVWEEQEEREAQCNTLYHSHHECHLIARSQGADIGFQHLLDIPVLP